MKNRLMLIVSACLLALSIVINAPNSQKASATVPGVNQLLNQDASGNYGNGGAYFNGNSTPYLSGDGRYVAFDSTASNLVSTDTNGYSDVFVKDTTTGTVTMASLFGTTTQFTGESYAAGISNDGRYVLIQNYPTSGGVLYEVRDLTNQTTTRICNNNCATMTNVSMSGDGKYVTYDVEGTYNQLQVVVVNIASGASKTLSVDSSGNPVNGTNYAGGISCDGGVIYFYSYASTMPSGAGGYIAQIDDPSGTLKLTKVNFSSQTAQVSCDGNEVLSDNGTDVEEFNRLTGVTTSIAYATGSNFVAGASMSGDGRYVTYESNHPGLSSYPSTGAGSNGDVYIYDMKTGTTQLVTFTVLGNRGGWSPYSMNTGISEDGSKVAYGYLTPTSTNTGEELVSGLTTGTSSTQRDFYVSKTGY